jgi:hypothetical protein
VKKGKIPGWSVTKDEDGISVTGDIKILIDDTDPSDIKIYAAPAPVDGPAYMGVDHALQAKDIGTAIRDVLAEKNDDLLEENEKLKETIDDKDELIGQLAKQVQESHQMQMRMYDKLLEKLDGPEEVPSKKSRA